MHMLLDSGAFSAWNAGAQIDLDDYIRFIRENIDYVSAYVNLDVIPGEPGRIPTPTEVEESAQQGWNNMLYMEGVGLSPVPVFHQGEQFKWLERMIEHGCEYIGISPANDRSTQQKQLWLDRVFNLVCDDDGYARVKTHAFGVTSPHLISRYPWHTVDSTTWLAAGSRFGLVRTPSFGTDGKWDWSRGLRTVRISKEAPMVQGHYDLLSTSEQQTVRQWIEECGYTVADARESRDARNECNARAFKMLAELRATDRFIRTSNFLFEEF